MQRRFITNLILLLFLNLLVKPFWVLAIDRTVQNVVGAESYGMYFALFNFSFLLNILLDVGITNFNNRNIAQHDYLITKHFSSIAILKFVLGLIYIAITLVAALLMGYHIEHLELLWVLIFNQFLISFILYLRSNLSGLHLFKTDSIISVLDRILMIGICSALLWGNITEQTFRIEWFIYTQTAAYSITAFVAFLLVFLSAKSFQPRWNLPFFILIMKQSFPFAILILLMTFYNRIDTVMIERMLPNGAVQAGIYAQAYRLLDATNMFAFLFAGLLLPLFSRMIKQKQSVVPLLNLSFRLLISFAIIIATVSCFYRTELMELLYVEHASLSAPIFGSLMLCFVAISTTYIFGTLLTANGNLKALNIMAGGGMLLNILLNIVLIPRYFAFGAAMASVATQFLTALVQVLIVQEKFKLPINYRLCATLFFFVACLLLLTYFVKGLDYDWKITLILTSLLATLLAMGLRLINVKQLFKIITKETHP